MLTQVWSGREPWTKSRDCPSKFTVEMHSAKSHQFAAIVTIPGDSWAVRLSRAGRTLRLDESRRDLAIRAPPQTSLRSSKVESRTADGDARVWCPS